VITVYRTQPKKKPVDITPENIKEQIQTLVASSKQ